MCQVILGQLITPIFQALSFCTLLSTALRLLAGPHKLGSVFLEPNLCGPGHYLNPLTNLPNADE